jgi:hypothetical protein
LEKRTINFLPRVVEQRSEENLAHGQGVVVSVPHEVGQPARELHLHRVGDQLELERSTRVDLRPGTGLAARIESVGLRPGPSCCRAMSCSRTHAYASENTIDPAVLINAQPRGSPCTHLT